MYAVVAVLSAIMGGLAIGGYMGGKIVDNHFNPLRLYGILEGLVGLYALIFPFLLKSTIPLLQYVYQDAQINQLVMATVRILVCFGILIIPAVLLGAMLPVLSKFFIFKFDHVSNHLGKLYGLNLLGSMVGSLATGFYFIPKWGLNKTIYLAVLIEFLICAWTFLLAKGIEEPICSAEKTKIPPSEILFRLFRDFPWIILLAMALSGAAAMVYELTWTRVANLLIGSSVYAFSLVLAAFIGGLAFGSLIFTRTLDKKKDLLLIFALLEIGIGGASLCLTPLFEKLPLLMVPLINLFSRNFALLQVVEFLGLFLLIFIPSSMIGAVFPLLSKIYLRNIKRVGHSIGSVYMANGLGAVLGILAAGLILIPKIGIQKTILVAVVINIFIGSGALLFSFSLSRIKKSVAIPLIICCTLIFAYLQPAWNKTLMSSGSYIFAGLYAQVRNKTGQNLRETIEGQGNLLFYKEGMNTTVSVKKDRTGEVLLQMNGKNDASSKNDILIQKLIAHIPLLLHPNPQEVMVLGLGTGMSLDAAKRYPIKRLDCLEISPAVIEASHYFSNPNDHVLNDPRIRLIVGDGREHLTLSRQKYDAIISHPSNPWAAGMSDLLTLEFFQRCRARLKENGLCCVWLQVYNLPLNNVRGVVEAFHRVFPRMTIWETKPAVNYLLLGSKDEIKIDYHLLQQKMAAQELQSELKTLGIASPEDLIAHFIMNEEGVSLYAKGAIPHTDDNSFLAFQAPKSLYQETMDEQLEAFNALRGVNFSSLGIGFSHKTDSPESLAKIFEAQKIYALSEMYFLKNMPEDRIRHLREAYFIAPWNLRIKDTYYYLLLNIAARFNQKGMFEQAVQTFLTATQVKPEGIEGYLNLGLVYFHRGYFQTAIQHFQTALFQEPANIQALLNLGAAYLRQGDLEGAIRENKALLELKSDHADAHFNLGIAFMKSRMFMEAIQEYKEAIQYRPEYAEAHFNLAIVYKTTGALDQAVLECQQALRIKPGFTQARRFLDQMQIRLKQGPKGIIP